MYFEHAYASIQKQIKFNLVAQGLAESICTYKAHKLYKYAPNVVSFNLLTFQLYPTNLVVHMHA